VTRRQRYLEQRAAAEGITVAAPASDGWSQPRAGASVRAPHRLADDRRVRRAERPDVGGLVDLRMQRPRSALPSNNPGETMKRINKRLFVDSETIKQLTGEHIAAVQGGVEEERCRTLWWQASCVPDIGSLQCTHNEFGCSGSGCTEVC
jgi:hypothetical protein